VTHIDYEKLEDAYWDGVNEDNPTGRGKSDRQAGTRAVVAALREQGLVVVRADSLARVVEYVRLRREVCLSPEPFEQLMDIAERAAMVLDTVSDFDLAILPTSEDDSAAQRTTYGKVNPTPR
jgi:hypothetical protein